MQLEDYFDFLAEDDIRIKGHRIGIESILYEYVHRSRTAEEIAAHFPTLSLEDVYATILYYLRNKAAAESYLAVWLAHGEKMRAEQERNLPPQLASLREAATGYGARETGSADN
jgi:uncharacterized protein (DUF433 family)